MSERRLDSTGDPGHSEEAPQPWSPPTMPDDARSLGLDRNTEEGAWVMMAASLDGAKVSHQVVAWLLLIVLVGIPILLRVASWLGA
ncbi:hypothetical protein [Nocardioides sp.]|uniref:hypothetical protein n=1 Tax=Nocardioides sp. TaxID=35761 RepID=UPI002ED0C007